jgi:hypothetical protein
VKLPRPEFFVLYNGTAPCPGRMTLKLSEAFENIEGVNSVNLELLVTVLNINKGHNDDIVNRSETLSGYVDFVDLVRHRQKQIIQGSLDSDDALKKSIIYAMNYCKEHHILEWFFNNLTMEEENMLAAEWNLEEALEVRAEEAWEDGIEEGIEQEREWIRGLLKQVKTVDELERMIDTAPPLTRKTDKTITSGRLNAAH